MSGSTAGIVDILAREDSFARALRYSRRDADFSLADGLRVPLLAGLLRERPEQARALLVVTATGREAERVQLALRNASAATVLPFPAWETLPHERLSPGTETVGRRFRALRALRGWRPQEGPLIVVASVRAALQPIVASLAEAEPVVLRAGEDAGALGALAERLVELAYTRVDMVTRRGEFAVRGGILDVFAATAEHPVRVELFGDEIEQMRAFSVADQRTSGEPLPELVLEPGRELLLDEHVRQRAAEMLHEFPNLSGILAKVAEGIPAEGMESLAPALAARLAPLVDFLPAQAAVAVLSPERVATRALHLAETNREFLDAAWNAATAGAQAPIDLEAGDFLTVTGLRQAAGSRAWWTLSAFDAGDAAEELREASADADTELVEQELGGAEDVPGVRLQAVAAPRFAPGSDAAVERVRELGRQGWSLVIASAGHGMTNRASDVLAERGIAAREVDAVPAEPEPGIAYLLTGVVEQGFESAAARLAVYTDSEFFGRTGGYDNAAPRRLAGRRRNVVDPLQLKPGDLVVHETHGIGRFVELTQREVSSGGRDPVRSTREYLVLEYAPSKRGHPPDRLSVPMDQLGLLSRYVGGEEPALSKMGGSDWAAAKGRARKAVRDIAVDLVKLYAARQASVGHAFSPDTPWQRELEEAFPYVETPDQLAAIDEVKRDMESPVPMDRLISGDVGFGKTEIAVRAAFKAVQDGKQVAVLVPTTLLVKQHGETFRDRFAGFPVHLAELSRFQTEAEAKKVLAGLADGTVDVVIGTHRLLSDGVRFKDLGLIVVDEEQRFGVEHKDALKKLRTNVDVLSMSATPIPRTLEMAVTGIREMSTLATPPEERHPILTFVGPNSDKQIAAAIRRELLREGQVFFVHNRVNSIGRVAAHLAELVPEARIGVAHGRLSEATLEKVVVDFWERRYDVLVCTTIIETGLDIANANTIIIDRADTYGLSQLHQLRGRVGRARERAYAYFLYDENRPLSETANDRLSTIAANNELGSGIQVALKDLELRGAGNLLGAEQSGHISGVGFDLYLRMIGEAVSTFRGEVAPGQTELRLELPVAAHIPEEYLDSERLRLEAYQKLSVASAPAAPENAIDLVLEELRDRYGEPPQEVLDLVRISRLRRRAQRANLSKLIVVGGALKIEQLRLSDSLKVRLQRLYAGSRYVEQTGTATIPLPEEGRPGSDDLVAWTNAVLDALVPEAAAQPAAESPEVASEGAAGRPAQASGGAA